ncbi:MAG: DUF4399 domain-containing protein [Chloroflexi bacterium]|nr:DUF4399 domain-containing protein [Chloroflexota bacterium]
MNGISKRWVVLIIGTVISLMAILATACGEGEEGKPSIEITAPKEGSSVSAGDVKVSIKLSNFKFGQVGGPNYQGEGHVHFYLDVDPVPTTSGKPAVSAEGTYHAIAESSYTWPNVKPGTHTLAVQLVNNDHTPLDPAIVTKVTITVK